MSEFAIETEALTKRYGKQTVVNDLTLQIPRGTVVGFVGPNGAGKTTTMRMLLGLVHPSKGSGTVLGQPITKPERYIHKVGALIEGPAFVPGLSGRHNLQILTTLGGHDADRIDPLLEQVSLRGRENDRYKTYSLGMKQRLGLAAALLCEPELLILDEPVNGLDPAGIADVRALLRTFASQGGTVFISSHLLSELELVSDHLVLINGGELVYAGGITDLTESSGRLIVTTARPEDLIVVERIAHEVGFSYELNNNQARITAPAEFAGELNRRCFEAGVVLEELSRERTSLEDVFLSITESDTNVLV
ncbi:MAG: ABC transporter ATP-binding protein [Acidimicrobiales bacterium]